MFGIRLIDYCFEVECGTVPTSTGTVHKIYRVPFPMDIADVPHIRHGFFIDFTAAPIEPAQPDPEEPAHA